MPDSATEVLPLPAPAHTADIVVRPIATPAELRECVELQRDVWGPMWTDIVPSSMLQVASYVGGILIGAFTPGDEMIGFIFGLTGVVNDEVVHWSHMLGVRTHAQNLGVGRLLKEAQRDELAQRGIEHMSWSFDPLIAKNAYFNLNRLGARVSHYVADMYGNTTSPLHLGLATDRLVVTLDTATPQQHTILAEDAAQDLLQTADPLPVVEAVLSLTANPLQDSLLPTPIPLPAVLRIEIPSDIMAVSAESPAQAARWRESVRRQFTWALANGYRVTRLVRDTDASRCYYMMVREP